MKQPVACSLVVNVSHADVPMIRHTIPHMIRSHKCTFAEVLLVIDERPAEGRLRADAGAPPADLTAVCDDLERHIRFRPVRIDYEPRTVRRVTREWFGDDRVTIRCSAGTPIYAFLFGLDQASCDVRLHLDADMLVHDPGPVSWVTQGMQILASAPDVAFVQPMMGPAHLDGRPHEFLAPLDPGRGLRLAHTFSTRSFMFSKAALTQRLLPIHPATIGLLRRLAGWTRGRRSPYLALEAMIARHLEATGHYRCDLDPEYGFSLHAWDKRAFLDSRIAQVLDRIEHGDVPPAQRGRVNLEADRFLASDM